jgi:predicted RecA/RadA family phage recombinase
MAKNRYLPHCDHLNIPVPASTVSGDGVSVSQLVGVALTDRATDGTATIERRGAFDLVVQAPAGGVAIGDALYIANNARGGITGTPLDTIAAGRTRFGTALGTLGASALGTIPVKIFEGN